MDKLRLKNLRFHAHHGCNQIEIEEGQTFELDIELSANLSQAVEADDRSSTYDFDVIYKIAEEIVTGKRFNLIETLAEELCSAILERYPDVVVQLVVRKPNPPIRWLLEALEVEITRGPAAR